MGKRDETPPFQSPDSHGMTRALKTSWTFGLASPEPGRWPNVPGHLPRRVVKRDVEPSRLH